MYLRLSEQADYRKRLKKRQKLQKKGPFLSSPSGLKLIFYVLILENFGIVRNSEFTKRSKADFLRTNTRKLQISP